MKNNNTCTAFANLEIKDLYRALITKVLHEHNVNRITIKDDIRRNNVFFHNIYCKEDGTIKVEHSKNGIFFDNFYFDFTCDFANCLAVIEDEIYLAERNGKSKHGYNVVFND